MALVERFLRMVKPTTSVILTAGLVTLGFASAESASAQSVVVGWLDASIGTADRQVVVSGWAVTSDAPAAAIGLRVRIDGQLEQFNGFHTIPHYRLANQYKNLAGSPYASYGNYHGFSFNVPIADGTHIVCIEGQNNGVYNTISIAGAASDGCDVVTISTPPDGFGRFNGGAWLRNQPANFSLTYSRPATYAGEIDFGAMAWNPVSNLGVSRTTGTANIAFFAQNYAVLLGTQWGMAEPAGCSLATFPLRNCTYSPVTVRMNTSSLDTESVALRTKVAGHEFGHALGLGHPPTPGVMTVMPQGQIVGNTSGVATSWDFQSFGVLYP